MKLPVAHSHSSFALCATPLFHGYPAVTAKAGGLRGRSSSYLYGEKHGAAFDAGDQLAPPRIAIIDGPYNAAALSNVLAREPVNLGSATCAVRPNSACGHGTFILGLLGARTDAPIPGWCPDYDLVHISLFADEDAAQAGVTDLARAIDDAVASGASLINLSLAILGDDGRSENALAIALDRAEGAGVVVMAAAGNQGRWTASQILSHPVTIPVVAMDAAGNLLPDCNFGPLISRKGVAALGHQVRGYAPDGGTTVMSGTSVATAVATGVVAQVWSARPNAEGDSIRAALTGLSRTEGQAPPRLGADALLVRLDQILASRSAAARIAPQSSGPSGSKLQGGSKMHDGNGLQRIVARAAASSPGSGDTIALAQGSGGCACGALSGSCTCSNGGAAHSSFVYVLGTVDCEFPDQSVSEEFQAVADTVGITQRDDESERSFVYRVLTANSRDANGASDQTGANDQTDATGSIGQDPTKPGPRYIARQLCWILRVEDEPAYHLALRDWQDLDFLILCLGEPHKRPGNDLVLLVGTSSPTRLETFAGITAPVLLVEQVSRYNLAYFTKLCEVAPPTAEKRPPRTRRSGAARPAAAPPTPEELGAALFGRLARTADNFGNQDDLRALNYLAVRYKPLYELYTEKVGSGEYTLLGVMVVPSRLQGVRRIVDPVFRFQRIGSPTPEMYFMRMDVTSLFPFVKYPLQLDSAGNFVPNYFDV
jgi:hypothetical protein